MSEALVSILETEVKLEASFGANLIIKAFLLLLKHIKNLTPFLNWRAATIMEEWIEVFYHRQQIHSLIGSASPAKLEEDYCLKLNKISKFPLDFSVHFFESRPVL
jgi:hypothetical protein